MEAFELNVTARDGMGKGASRRLRHEGKLPAIVYGGDKEPMNVSILESDLRKQLENEAFYSHVVNLIVDGTGEQVVLKDLQRHPSRPFVMHADFLRVSASTRLNMNVPLHFINEEHCPGVKLGGGNITHLVSNVEIRCFPKDLPEFIEVDLGELQLGETIHLSDLKVSEGVEIAQLVHGSEHDLPVVSVAKGRGASSDDDDDVDGEADTEEAESDEE